MDTRKTLVAVVCGLLLLAPAAAAVEAEPSPPPAGAPAAAPAAAPAGAPGPAPAGGGLPRTVSAWLPYWDQEGAYRDALEHAGQLHTVSPFWYQAHSAERVAGHRGAGERRIVDGLRAAGIQVVPTVMETMPAGKLAEIVTTPALRARHVDALLAVVRAGDHDGLDIDYESIAPTGDATWRAVRDGYADLLTELCDTLHELRKQCIATVTPQTAVSGRVWDYERLGRVADRVRIMAYNLHWATGKPGPIASPEFYEDILANATAKIPRDKLEMGLPAYGWDWAEGSDARARHVTWHEAEALRKEVGAPYEIDEDSRTPHFDYEEDGVRRQVWYQDARGVAEHLEVLRRHGVESTALWALNFEDPALWAVLAGG
ncbi:glycosyl hydrolase family 18 protein [Streptomyces sp. NPDC060194]|uniref:glycosyl hydrolase family 18 protein n=1 Tax=Streptomyces sp. NPDC060194 TaxID=3347069 RepID=UPI003658FBBC